MGGNSYDFYITEYEKAKKNCTSDLCIKKSIIELLRNEWSSSFINFQNSFQAFQNKTGESVDYKETEKKYNDLYAKMERSKKDLEEEIESLDQLIKSQMGNTKNYDEIIEERNKTIKKTANLIQNKTDLINTAKEDIENNIDSKDTLSFFGIFRLSNVPLEINYIKNFYQILMIVLLLLFIFLIQLIKKENSSILIQNNT